MTWEISSEPRTGTDRIYVAWAGGGTVYDVSLESGDGVGRTSMGGNYRAEMTRFDPPIMGIFAWELDTHTDTETSADAQAEAFRPVAILSWRPSRHGDLQSEQIDLG